MLLMLQGYMNKTCNNKNNSSKDQVYTLDAGKGNTGEINVD